MAETEPRYQVGTVVKPARLKGEKCMVDTKRGLVYCIPLLQRYYEVPPDDMDFEDWGGDFGEALPFNEASVALDAGIEILRVREIE
jgi:hypothetical protein